MNFFHLFCFQNCSEEDAIYQTDTTRDGCFCRAGVDWPDNEEPGWQKQRNCSHTFNQLFGCEKLLMYCLSLWYIYSMLTFLFACVSQTKNVLNTFVFNIKAASCPGGFIRSLSVFKSIQLPLNYYVKIIVVYESYSQCHISYSLIIFVPYWIWKMGFEGIIKPHKSSRRTCWLRKVTICAINSCLSCLFFLNRRNTLGKLVSVFRLRCSMWCLIQVQPTCGCHRKSVHRSPQRVVSVHVNTYKQENYIQN